MNPTTHIKFKQLARKSWQLWVLTFLVLFIYAFCIIIVTDPAKWEAIVKTPAQNTITIILISMLVLTFLFCVYVIINERRVNKLRNLLVNQQGLFLRDTTFRLSALEKIYHLITKDITSYLPAQLPKMLDDIAQVMKELFKANYVSLMLIDPADNRLKTQGLAGIESEPIRSAILKLGEAIAGYVTEKNEGLLLNEHTDYSKYNGYFKKELAIQSALSIPLIMGQETLGVINITRLVPTDPVRSRSPEATALPPEAGVTFNGADNFTDLDLRTLRSLAQDLALSIKYVQQLKELQAREATLMQERSFVQIGKVAASLAHDLKNALFVAQGYLEMLKSDPLLSGQMDNLHRVQAELEKVLQIIRNLLILGKHFTSRKKQTDFNRFIEAVLEPLKETLSNKGIVLVLRLAAQPPIISVDPEQLEIALTNLIKNAWEAMENSTRKELTLATEIVAGGMQIKIADTGVGIAPERIPQIFDTFFTTKALGAGTGLGLSITNNIIRAHKGKIEVASEPGQGTTFTITLPLT